MKYKEFESNRSTWILVGEENGRVPQPDVECQELGRVRLLTIDYLNQVVEESMTGWGLSTGFKDYETGHCNLYTPEESFGSLIRSLGIYIDIHNVPHPDHIFSREYDETNFFHRLAMKRWNEAEERTFYNPILFKKL